MPRFREREVLGRALGTRIHPDERGVHPVYQPTLLPSDLPVAALPHPAGGCPPFRGERNAERMPSCVALPSDRIRRIAAGCALAALFCLTAPTAAAHDMTASTTRATSGVDLVGRGWVWPAEGFRLARAYVAPAHEYGPGHRGIDLELRESTVVRAPADGVTAFAGSVAGRGILTIDHGDGLVTTLEPVTTALAPGSPVTRGDDVATLGLGGHAAPGSLHFGVRLDGEYINPMLLLGDVPRAVLLPCWA